MPKKLISMEQGLADKLTELAKRHGTTQSRIVDAALTVYLTLDLFAPKGTERLSKLNNQVTIDDVLKETERRFTRKDS